LANEEILKKGRQIKELNKKIEIYEGKNLEGKSQVELQQAV